MDDLILGAATAEHVAPVAEGAQETPQTAPAQTSPESEQGHRLHWVRAIVARPGYGVRTDASAGLQFVCDTGMYSLDA
jgi:hypothetical protein